MSDLTDWETVDEAQQIIEQQQRKIDNLQTQVDAGLRFSGWMREVACKSGWQPIEARSDYDAVVGYVSMIEEENHALAAYVERINSFIDSWPLDDAESDPDFANSLFDLIGESPKTILIEVRAEAVEGFADWCIADEDDYYLWDFEEISERAKDYADKIREGKPCNQ